MVRTVRALRRKPRLRTELSDADERRLREAVALFGLPKAEVVRRLIRASVQAGPALSADNTRAVEWLGYEKLIGLEEGLSRTIDWWKTSRFAG